MRKRAIALAVLCCFLLGGCGIARRGQATKRFTALDTACAVTLYGTEDEALLEACVRETARLEALWSRTVSESDIARVNAANEVQVSAETATLLSEALAWSEKTDGAFDITVASYKALWEAANGGENAPSAAQLAAASQSVGREHVTLAEQCVTRSADTKLDLGAIAKGAVAQALCRTLKEGGCQSALIDLGGNITAVGSKPDGSPFRIGIEDPRDPERVAVAVAVRDKTLSTSGSYQRWFEIGGQRYSHILDPKNGQPIDNDLLSVTVISADAVEADVLSTACFVMGYERARAFLETVSGAQAVFLLKSGEVIATEGVEITEM